MEQPGKLMALKLFSYTLPKVVFFCKLLFGVAGTWRLQSRFGVTRIVASSIADLGGSSKYTSGTLVDRSGERFHENSD